MCVNQKWVKTPYMRHPVLVKCGHCKACQQEKANARAMRIKNNVRSGEIALFVTLTYTNECVPYVFEDDVRQLYRDFNNSKLNNDGKLASYLKIYRDCEYRRVRTSSDYEMRYKKVPSKKYIRELCIEYEDLEKRPQCLLHPLEGCANRVGVLQYKDVQDFFKRLRINLQRKYDYKGNFSAFVASEYGETTFRPHFHLLLFIRYEDEALFRHAIREAWPYADWPKLPRAIETARDAASYVASYTNCGSDFPAFLTLSDFRPKSSHTKAFGLVNDHFTLPSIKEKIRKRDLTYPVAKVTMDGFSTVDILLPKYVINRYFPLFKGHSKLPTPALLELLKNPKRLRPYSKQLDLSPDDLHSIFVRLDNAYKRYIKCLNLKDSYVSKCAFASDYVECHHVRNMNVLKMFYENKDNIPLLLMYDNWSECFIRDTSVYWSNFVVKQLNENPKLRMYENPNTFPHVVSKDWSLTDLFEKKMKTKKVNNVTMHEMNTEY